MSSNNSTVSPTVVSNAARQSAAKKPRPAQSHLAVKSLIISLSIVGTLSGWGYLAWQQHGLDAMALKEAAALNEPMPKKTTSVIAVPVAVSAPMAAVMANPPMAETAAPRVINPPRSTNAAVAPAKRITSTKSTAAVKPAKANPAPKKSAAAVKSAPATQAAAPPVLREVPVAAPAKTRVRSRSSR